MKKGFTLIELLIVVAIIAILAAIAVPNFLEAQTRAKVSRMVSNLRTVATGIEMYTVDHNTVPLTTYNSNPVRRPGGGNWTRSEEWKIWPGGPGLAAGLTTPVAYLSSNDPMVDVFRTSLGFAEPLAFQILYLPSNFYQPGAYGHAMGNVNTFRGQMNRYGTWVLRSAGPDQYYMNTFPIRQDFSDGMGGWNRASYDPTNGTISGGDIYRSQMRPEESHAQK